MSGKRQNLYYQAVNMWSAGGLNTGIDLASRLTGARFDNGPRAHGVYPLISQCFVYDSEDERGVVEALLAQWIGLDEEEASDPPCRFCGDREACLGRGYAAFRAVACGAHRTSYRA
jgi:hypothetical protein